MRTAVSTLLAVLLAVPWPLAAQAPAKEAPRTTASVELTLFNLDVVVRTSAGLAAWLRDRCLGGGVVEPQVGDDLLH